MASAWKMKNERKNTNSVDADDRNHSNEDIQMAVHKEKNSSATSTQWTASGLTEGTKELPIDHLVKSGTNHWYKVFSPLIDGSFNGKFLMCLLSTTSAT